MAKQQKIDINAASIDELTRIPGVNEETAEAIVDFRKNHGRINDLEELADAEEITPENLDNLREWVTVGAGAGEEEEEMEEEEEEW